MGATQTQPMLASRGHASAIGRSMPSSMDDPFPLDAVRTMVRQTLAGHCRHRDFEDIVQEAVLAAWLASQRHPEFSVAVLARQNARWQLYEWFRSAKCGDLS